MPLPVLVAVAEEEEAAVEEEDVDAVAEDELVAADAYKTKKLSAKADIMVLIRLFNLNYYM